MESNPKPYVTAALLCEKVLQEKDGTLSIIRIADRLQYQVQGVGLPPGVKPGINVHGLISLKSGPASGDHKIRIVAERPNGERKDVYALPVRLSGNDQGQNVVLNMTIGVEQDGLYWFDVMFDGELLTRIPLMITPLPEQESAGQSAP